MEFTVKSLQDKIPASVYELLTTEDYMNLPLPKESDIDAAHAIITPRYPYGGWKPIRERMFCKEQLEAVTKCTVVESEYGLSMKFLLVNKDPSYIPCSNSSVFEVGQEWNASDLKILELARDGEEHSIFRVMPVAEHITLWNGEYSKEVLQREILETIMLKRYNSLLRRDGKKVSIFKYLRLY